MSVKEYALKFHELLKYAPTVVEDSRVKMNKFVTSISVMVVKELCTTILIGVMDISRLMIPPIQIHEEKLKENYRS